MKTVFLTILLLAIAVCAHAAGVTLTWDPNTETDLAGYKVFHAADPDTFDFATVLDVKNVTTVQVPGLDPAKSHKFAVKAYNTAGMESTFSNVVTVPETLPPVVSISIPDVITGTTTVIAEATDNVGVTMVELYVDGALTATQIEFPYTFSWETTPLKAGEHTIMIKAYDSAGNVGQVSKSVTIHESPVSPRNLKWRITLNVPGGQ